MKRVLIAVSLLVSITSAGQPLRDINYEYQYNPDAAVMLQLRPVRTDAGFTVVYSLHVKDTANFSNDYTIEWEGRQMLSDREGTPLVLSQEHVIRTRDGLEGRGSLSDPEAPNYLMARVTRISAKRAWLFYTALHKNYPVNNFFLRGDSPVVEPYVHTNDRVKLAFDSALWFVSYYNDDFPAAAPAFSEAQARVSARMAVDSVFTIQGSEMTFSKKGLYLIQKDTNAATGVAFRAEEDYPQYSKLVNLSGPLMYISTRQENERLKASKGNKKAFDRIVLSITADTERARRLMRDYFRRVELANRYFTSYKEGWKTDRGMIYIIFGKPDEVFRFDDREVWAYKNDRLNMRFNFSEAPTVFDPDNFVLIREKKFEDEWYEVIDLWRNARF